MSACRAFGAADMANVSGLMASLISNNLATLRELQTIYSYDDALDMSEVLTVRNYNEWAAREAASKRGR